MKNCIVHSLEPMALVGGAAVNHDLLLVALQRVGPVVAADSGALPVLAAGVVPDAVIGDLDSLPPAAMAQIPAERLHRIADQDTTDFDKCLSHLSAPYMIGVGFSGGRLDHQLAALGTLVRHAWQRCVLLGETDLVFLAPPTLRLDLPKGSVVSLFPFGAVEGISEGLRWPINGLNFAPDGRVGTSNEVTGDVLIAVTAPKMLVILPRAALDHVLAAFERQPAGWPARETRCKGQPQP